MKEKLLKKGILCRKKNIGEYIIPEEMYSIKQKPSMICSQIYKVIPLYKKQDQLLLYMTNKLHTKLAFMSTKVTGTITAKCHFMHCIFYRHGLKILNLCK